MFYKISTRQGDNIQFLNEVCYFQINVCVGGKEVLAMSVLQAAKQWEETSFNLEKLQANPECAEQEFLSLDKCKHITYHVPFSYRDFVLGEEKH